MESWTLPIEFKNSPFDKSNESIESTTVYGAVLRGRNISKSRLSDATVQWKAGLFRSKIRIVHSTNRTNRSNRQQFMGQYYEVEIYLSLANEMQKSNGKLDSSNRI